MWFIWVVLCSVFSFDLWVASKIIPQWANEIVETDNYGVMLILVVIDIIICGTLIALIKKSKK